MTLGTVLFVSALICGLLFVLPMFEFDLVRPQKKRISDFQMIMLLVAMVLAYVSGKV